MATLQIRQAVRREIDKEGGVPAGSATLDIGSGNGALVQLLREAYGVKTHACDYTTALMKLSDQPVDLVDLNHEALPYPNEFFSLVTCTEVIEHLENHFALLREIHRVLAPGGIAVFSTPNVLNLRSRLRYLSCGFANLFGPLPVDGGRRESTGGHINPLGAFYLGHALANIGFGAIRFSTDKWQRGSWPAMLLLWLPIQLAGRRCKRLEKNRWRTLDRHNEPLFDAINSNDMLMGRTLIACVRKPSAATK